MGVKGCGEAGAIGAPAAIINALTNAIGSRVGDAGDAREGLAGASGSTCGAGRRVREGRAMYDFEYHKPTSLAEAAKLLAGDVDAKLMAGGQTYIPTLKQRLAQPTSVIDLGGIAELKGIKEEAGGLTIGAMAKHGEVAASDVVKRVIPALWPSWPR